MKNLRILSLVLVLFLSGSMLSYGAASHLFKDGTIEVKIPGSWNVLDDTDIGEDEEDEELYYDFDWIFKATKTMSGAPISLNLQYTSSDAGDMYLDDEDANAAELTDFNDEYGEELIDELFYYEDDYTISTGKEYRMLSGQYMKVPVKVGTKQKVVYYTLKGGAVVSFIASNDNGELNKKQIAEIEKIIDSYSDSGYYDEFEYIEDGYEDDYDEYGDENDEEYYYDSDADFLLGFIIILIVGTVIAVLYFANKKVGAKPAARPTTDNRRSTEDRTAAPVHIPDEPVERTNDEAPRFERKKTVHHSDLQGPEKPAFSGRKDQVSKDLSDMKSDAKKPGVNPHQRYLDSLKEMVESGLMTKEQYDQIKKRYK